jgi:dienelactone hydrolase
VLQEWWGVNEQVQLQVIVPARYSDRVDSDSSAQSLSMASLVQAQRLAGHGYRVIVPDLYRGPPSDRLCLYFP